MQAGAKQLLFSLCNLIAKAIGKNINHHGQQ